jgi:hypothetical protein
MSLVQKIAWAVALVVYAVGCWAAIIEIYDELDMEPERAKAGAGEPCGLHGRDGYPDRLLAAADDLEAGAGDPAVTSRQAW